MPMGAPLLFNQYTALLLPLAQLLAKSAQWDPCGFCLRRGQSLPGCAEAGLLFWGVTAHAVAVDVHSTSALEGLVCDAGTVDAHLRAGKGVGVAATAATGLLRAHFASRVLLILQHVMPQ